MSKTKTEKKRYWLNRSEMADSLAISVQAFERWGVEPVAKMGRETFFTARDVLDNRLEHQESKRQQSAGLDPAADSKLIQERLRLTAAQADGQELKNQVTRRTLIPAEFATFALSKLAPEIAAVMDTLPMTMRRKHPELEARHIATLEREATKIRNACSEFADKLTDLADEYFKSTD